MGKQGYLQNTHLFFLTRFMLQMNFLFIFVSIVVVSSSENDADQRQCEDLCSFDVNEIDIGKFLTGTDAEKKQIAGLFDRSFHQHGVIRLINVGITSDIIDRSEQFFALDKDTKMKYFLKGSFYETPGYKPPGLESVSNYKGDQKAPATDSTELFFTWFNAQSKQLNLSIDQLPDVLHEVIPKYILHGRQLISDVHQIADLALGLKENTLDGNYTNDHALYQLRLAKYFPPTNDGSFSLGEHQDYFGFTLIQNDDVPGKREVVSSLSFSCHVSGLEVNVNGRWFRLESKPDTLLVVGGECIQRWTNDHWISALHRVAAVKRLRYSALFFSGPDVNSMIETLPCEMCTEKPSRYSPITAQEHFQKRQAAAASFS